MNRLFTQLFFATWLLCLLTLFAGGRAQAQRITISGNVSPTATLCAASSLSLTFATSGTFASGNSFSLIRSNADGTFPARPIVIGSVTGAPTSATTLTVSGRLDAVAYGTKYRFGVVSSAPSQSATTTADVTIGTDVPSGPTSVTLCANSGLQPISVKGQAVRWYTSPADSAPVSETGTTYNVPTNSAAATYYATQTVGECPSAKLPISVTTQAPAPPTLSKAGPFCQYAGTASVETITADGTNRIEWFASMTASTSIAAGNSFTVSTATATAKTVYFRQVVNGCASAITAATITVNAAPAKAPTFADVRYCAGTTSPPLTATLTDGATSARWYPIAPLSAPVDGVSIPVPGRTTAYQIRQLIGTCEGPLSTTYTVTIQATTPSPVPDKDRIGPFCQNSGTGTVQTVVVNPTGTGTVEWLTSLSASTSIAAGSSYTVSTAAATPQTLYYRQVIAGCPSSIQPLVVAINPLPAAPGVRSLSVCQNDTPQSLSATGSGPTFTWYVQGSSTALPAAPRPLTSQPNSQTVYEVTQTSGSGCTSLRSNGLTFYVRSLPAKPDGLTAYSYCEAQAPTSLTASGTRLRWYAGGGSTLGAFLSNDTYPAPRSAGELTFQVTQTDAFSCQSEPLLVAVKVKTTPQSPTSAYASNVAGFCQGRSSQALAASGTSLQWYTRLGGPASALAPSPATTTVGDSLFYVTQTSTEGCVSSPLTITARVYAIPGQPTFTQPRDYCAGDVPAPLMADGQALRWYSATAGGNSTSATVAPTPSTAASNVGTVQSFSVTQTINGCESGRQTINVTVKRKPDQPVTQSLVEFCQTYSAPTLTATAEAGATLTWIAGSTASSTAPPLSNAVAQSYAYAVLQTLNGCRSDQAPITVRVKPTPGQPAIRPFQLCQFGQGQSLQATAISGATLAYYDASGNLLGATAPVLSTSAAQTLTYQVTQSLSGCEGPRITYAVVVYPKPDQPVTQAINYCVETSNNPDQPKQTVRPLTAQGSNLRWYFSDGNEFPAAPTPVISGTSVIDFRVTQTVNNCLSDYATLRVTIQATPAPTVATSLVTYCRNDVARPLEATGSNLRWIDPNGNLLDQSPTSPTPPTANATKGGETYQVYAVGTNGCVSPRSAIRLVVNTNPTLGLLGSTTVNYGQSAPLRLRFTSSPPYAYTLSDGTSGVAQDTLATILLKPLQTTTYQVVSVSNVCGNGLPGNPATATINVTIPQLTTQALASSTLCAGTSFAVTYATSGTFNLGNTFKVQLVDTTATLRTYVDVSGASTDNTLTANLPSTLKGGVYFVRVLATNPGAEVGGVPSPTLLTVQGLPGATLSGTQAVYEGSPASLSIALSGAGPWTITYTQDGSQSSTFQTNANPHTLTVQPAKTANYFLTTISNNCGSGVVSGTATVTVMPLLAVEDPLTGQVSVYPLPTQHLLTVAIERPLTPGQPAQLQLRDLTGQPVLTRQTDARQTVLDLSQQPAGLYLLSIQVGDQRTVRRVVKL